MIGIVVLVAVMAGLAAIGKQSNQASDQSGSPVDAIAPQASQPPTPTTAITVDPLSQLRAVANASRSQYEASLIEHWVAQVGSKTPGVVDPKDLNPAWRTIPYTYPMILQNYVAWQRSFGAILVWSSDYSSLTPGFWVVLIPRPFSDGDSALGWCKAKGLSPNDCSATLLSHTQPSDHSTHKFQ